MPSFATTGRALAGALVLLAGLAAVPAVACPVCIDLPERTVADRLLGDKVVVLARPDPDNSFKFRTVGMLVGLPRDLVRLPEIPFLVDSATRRKLLADESLVVMLSYGPTGVEEDGSFGGDAWHRLMTVTPERREVIDRVLVEGRSWDRGIDLGPERFAFFAALHADPDRTLQRMALTEIERSPYARIRTVRTNLPTAELRRRLSTVNELAFAPLYILLLGASDKPEADRLVMKGFGHALAHGGLSLSAWVVAGIEVDGADALDRAAASLLDGRLTADDRSGLLEALTVTGRARPDLRPAILPTLHEAARRYPEHAVEIADTLHAWRDWTLAPYFAALLDDGPDLDPASRFVLETLVRAARDEAS